MRLLNVNTYELQEFYSDIPAYAILSHRWSASEARLRDLQQWRTDLPASYTKVHGFARYVKTHLPEIAWIWIDSCCINQDSASELSEGVNRMFAWYRDASVCCAYLSDVREPLDDTTFRMSVWHTRGWTLQELLASRLVVFLASEWQVIGHKGDRSLIDMNAGPRLELTLSEVSNIPLRVLKDFSNSKDISVAEKLNWMAGRQTTREEDMVYALFGIFGVNPGANYGEGEFEARIRLNEAIEKRQRSIVKAKDTVQDEPPAASWTASARSFFKRFAPAPVASPSPSVPLSTTFLSPPFGTMSSITPPPSTSPPYPFFFVTSATSDLCDTSESSWPSCLSQDRVLRLMSDDSKTITEWMRTYCPSVFTLGQRYASSYYEPTLPNKLLVLYCAPTIWHIKTALAMVFTSVRGYKAVIRVDPRLGTGTCSEHTKVTADELEFLLNQLKKVPPAADPSVPETRVAPCFGQLWLQIVIDLDDDDASPNGISHRSNSLVRYIAHDKGSPNVAATIIVGTVQDMLGLLENRSIPPSVSVRERRTYRLRYDEGSSAWDLTNLGKV